MRLFPPALVLLAVMAGHAGPVAKPAPSTKKSASPPVATDAQIEQAIRERFARSKISTNRFRVRVQGGIATLEGQTGVIQHKGTATRLAKAAGAVRVVNRIEVSDEAKEKAAGNLATGRRRAQVKRSEVTGRH